MHSRLHAHIGTLRQLEILLAVYEHDGITAASEALHLTQPTVSAQVKKLTNAIGTPLYNQVGRKLIFTDAGLATVATARKVLDQFAQLDMQLADLRGLKSGTLKLAVVTTSKYFIPHLLGPFCKRYPDVDIQLKVGNRRQILERLLEGSDDFYVISHPPEDTKLEKIELLPNPLVAISASKHSLSQRKHISITDLCNERFLMREAGSGTRYAIEEFLRKKQIELHSNMTIESNEAIKHAVMSGLGVSILSAHTLAFGGKAGLSVLNVESLPIATHWYFVWQREKPLSLITEAFLNHVKDEGKSNLLRELQRMGVPWQ